MNAAPSAIPAKYRFRLAIAAAALAAYALIGFLLVPWAAKRELPRIIEEGIHHRATMAELGFNPFTLTWTARDFALADRQGRTVFGFAEAQVDLEWRSLVRGAWIVSEVLLVKPALHAEIEKDGRLNLAALIPGGDAGKMNAGDAGAAPRLPRMAIGRLALENGRIAFEDKREGFRDSLEKISFELHSLSTLDDEKGPYTFVGQTPGGASLHWSGEISPEPLVATGTLSVNKLALAELMPYIDDVARVRIVSGQGEIKLPYRIALAGGKPLFTLHGAMLDVRNLELQEAATAGSAQKPSFAKLDRFSIAGVDADFSTRHVSAHALHLDDASFVAARNASGELDLSRLLLTRPERTDPDAKSARDPDPDKQPWQLQIATVALTNVAADYSDATARTPVTVSMRGLSGTAKMHVESGGQGMIARADTGEFAIAQVGAAPASEPAQPPMLLSRATISGARFDSGERTLAIDALRLASLNLNATLQDGRVSLLDLLPVFAGGKAGKPYSASIATAELGESRVSVTDSTSGVTLQLARLTAKLSGVSSDSNKPLTFDAGADVASGGRVALRGNIVPAQGTLAAQLDASALALAPLQPFLERYASVKLVSGEATLSGSLRAGGKSAKSADAKLSFAGKAAVVNLALDDVTGVRLLGWKSLATESLRISFSPNQLDIDELRWTAPAGRLAIATDGSSNISRAFTKKNAEAKAPEATPPAAAVNAAPAPESNAPPAAGATAAVEPANAFAVTIRRVRVADGALEFSDDSLSPRYVARIFALAGTANALSSDRSTRSQFDFEGRLDEFGYAHLSGSVNPFQPRERSSFRVQLQNVDLAATSPYSMRFAGYRIASGRMSLDLNYRLRNNALEGDNKITLEKLTLGERVESPDAFKLPLTLAIALLKDEDGTISMDLPVTGNLDDPKFSLAPIIWKAVGNFLGRIVAAPFRAMSHLLGGGKDEEAGAIVFDPGTSRLLPPEQEKIVRIAGLLAKRTELKLLIPAHVDTEADGRALKRAALGRDVARRAGFAVADDESPGPINIEDRPTRSALRTLFSQRFGAAELDKLKSETEQKARAANLPAQSVVDRMRSLATGEPQVADAREFYGTLTRRLRDSQPLPQTALAELAQKRTLAIEAALKAAGADQARIARSAGEPTADAEAKVVKLQLSLTMH